MGFEISNITNIGFLMKLVELVFMFILLMLERFGYKGHLFGWGNDPDTALLGSIAVAGYFFFIILIMVGMAMGDKATIQNLLFNLFGFLFLLSLGSVQIDDWHGWIGEKWLKDTGYSMGSMAIITSIIFLVDTVFSVMGIMSGSD